MPRSARYEEPARLCVTSGYDPRMWDYDGSLTLDNRLACVICHHCPAYELCTQEREANPRLYEGTIRAAAPIESAAALKKRRQYVLKASS